MKKKCNKCGKDKLVNDFHKNNVSKDGKQNFCKQCRSKLDADRYKEGKELLAYIF